MDTLKVVAVASSEETRTALYKQLQGMGFVDFDGVYIELSDAVTKCQTLQPDVIIVELTGRELDGGLFIQAIGMNPENPCVIFALHRQMDVDVFKEAVRRGAKEFIQYPEDQEGLTMALRKHLALISRVATQTSSLGQQQDTAAQGDKARMIASFSPKGGAGSSTIATNVAYELQLMGYKTIFLDLDQFYLNSFINLKVKPDYSLGDLAQNSARDIDPAMIDKITAKHASGMHVIVGNKNILDDNELVPPELLQTVLDHLSSKYDYIIVDLPSHVLDPYHQYIVERADNLLLISGFGLPGIDRTRQYLQLAQRYLDLEKIKLIMNFSSLKATIGATSQELEALLNHDIYLRIPHDWETNIEADSRGMTLSQVKPKSEIVKAIQKLARLLSGQEQPEVAPAKAAEKSGGGLLGKLFTGSKSPKLGKGNPANVIQ